MQTTGHQLFAAVKEFMVMLVVEENLSLTLAAMLMTAVMSEEKTQRCSNAIVDVARQMSMVDDTDEWNAQDEDCKEGRLQVQLLSVNAGSAEGKAGYARLDPSSERITKAKSRKAKRAEVKELGTAWARMVTCCAHYLSYVVRVEVTWEQLVRSWKILTPGHFLRQGPKETILELLGRHRQAMRDLRTELKRIEESSHEPEEKDYVRNLLLAPVKR